jgi:RNA polymerase primary sigma factor
MDMRTSDESVIKQYFNSVGKHTMLTPEEEISLAREKVNGSERAKQRMINANLRLVIKIAKGYLMYESSLIDLIQEGNIGLIRATEKFDPEMGCRFSTYASYWIRHYITRFIAKRSRSIRIPIRKSDLFKKISRAKEEYIAAEGREPSVEEIARYLRVDTRTVQDLVEAFMPTVSLDSPLGDDDFNLMDLLGDARSTMPESGVIDRELSHTLESALAGLIENERNILTKRFGLNDTAPLTLKEIGGELGVSAETIRQIESRALGKIRKEHSYLRDYIAC